MQDAKKSKDGAECASDGIYNALTSNVMKFNFVYVAVLYSTSFIFSYKAAKVLKYHNIFSSCTRILLYVGLLNSVIYHITVSWIRIKSLHRMILYYDDRCLIQFSSSECYYEQHFLQFTILVSTGGVISLTFDRFFSHFFRTFYEKRSIYVAWFLVGVMLAFSISVYIHVFVGVELVGSVPICFYPPQLATGNFDMVNIYRTYLMTSCIVLTLIILFNSWWHDRKIRRTIFDSKIRYTSFECLTTTKSVSVIIIGQFLFLILSSVGVTMLTIYKYTIPESLFHCLLPYLSGNTYANIYLPLIICFQTRRIIKSRRKNIGKMTKVDGNIDEHINALKLMWQ